MALQPTRIGNPVIRKIHANCIRKYSVSKPRKNCLKTCRKWALCTQLCSVQAAWKGAIYFARPRLLRSRVVVLLVLRYGVFSQLLID